MLKVVDHGYLLGDVVASSETPTGIVRIADSGPEGFSQAVRQILDEWR
jgi:hypothetical protein